MERFAGYYIRTKKKWFFGAEAAMMSTADSPNPLLPEIMKPDRPTMKDIAKVAKVHQTTVSLALRNHPSIPQKTRERIKGIADELGYRPDPMLASLIAYRRGRSGDIKTPSIGYIMNVDGEQGLKNSYVRQLFLKGAMDRAKELGYGLEVFYYGGRHYHSRYLDKVLNTRNISGIILAGFLTHFTDIELSWDHFSVVKIEVLPFHVRTHTIENNQYQVVRRSFQELRKLGFRRIGLCVAEHDEKHTRNLFSAGYYVEQAAIPEQDRIPLMVFPGNEFYEELGDNAQRIVQWMTEHRLDACMSNWTVLGPLAEEASQRIGSKVHAVPLDLDCSIEGGWGMVQNHEIVGASAVEVVSGLMQQHQKGQTPYPRTNLINATWRGPDLETIETIRAERVLSAGGV
jgi:LacI family transcriptional regulator